MYVYKIIALIFTSSEEKLINNYQYNLLIFTDNYSLLYQGWHLETLLRAKIVPLRGPCFLITIIAYSEQVGENLHDGGKSGEMKYL